MKKEARTERGSETTEERMKENSRAKIRSTHTMAAGRLILLKKMGARARMGRRDSTPRGG